MNPMKKIDVEVTKKVATLSRLKLTDAEIREFTPQLESILQYIDQLSKVNVQGVEPLFHPIDVETPLREDRVVEFKRSESGSSAVIDVAPAVDENGYRVPPILS